MKLIADGGSTKTDWRILHEGREYKQIQTTGFNPYLVTSEQIEDILWKELQPFIDNNAISEVYYYGAGCSTPSKNMVIEHAFEKVFTNADFYIEHDLLGAARSSCGNSEGIACILGTGSNSCFYDGKFVTGHIFSLGYFFGDEGSGAYMGKQLLTSYLHNELPEDLVNTFQASHNLSNENILDAVYNKPAPSRFLASFSTFISDNRHHPIIDTLIRNNFRNFYRYQVACYPRHKDVPVNFVGSVAYHYQDILHEIGGEFGITIGKIIQAPIDGLVDYHRQ